jgi:hypothetical protein
LVENPAQLYKFETSARSTAPGAAAGSPPKIADELVTELCVGGDHVITALGADASNRSPNRSEPPIARLEIVNNLDDCAAERKGAPPSHAAAEAYSGIEFFFR